MKYFQRISSIIIALCFFLILLINAFDYSIYYRPDFYEKTFAKYEVTDYAMMDMSEVLKVSDYLIDYLKGDEESLEDFRAVVNGEERIFYSEREILHMEDVKNLFIGGLWIRKICIGISLVLLLVLFLTKKPFIQTFLRCIISTFLSILGILGVLVLVISSNFSKAFVIFHELFFNNDLWILNPDEDWVIRLLPEGFFMDMVIVIGIVFTVSLVVVLGICFIGLRIIRERTITNEKETV